MASFGIGSNRVRFRKKAKGSMALAVDQRLRNAARRLQCLAHSNEVTATAAVEISIVATEIRYLDFELHNREIARSRSREHRPQADRSSSVAPQAFSRRTRRVQADISAQQGEQRYALEEAGRRMIRRASAAVAPDVPGQKLFVRAEQLYATRENELESAIEPVTKAQARSRMMS